METQTVNIIIFPPKETLEQSRELAELLEQKYEMEFSLANTKFLPHISIRQMRIPNENYEKLKSKLQEILERVSTFQLSLGSYEMFAGLWPSWICDSSKTLRNLHTKMTEDTNNLRNGLKLLNYSVDGKSSFLGQKFSPERTENILKYGWSNCMKLYDPHITLGKTKNLVDVQDFTNLLPQYNSVFEVDEIYIGRMESTPVGNQLGYVLEILDGISLGK